jgi:endogenous inhibitor of DNA gyrase (YacG/DUF329 family)
MTAEVGQFNPSKKSSLPIHDPGTATGRNFCSHRCQKVTVRVLSSVIIEWQNGSRLVAVGRVTFSDVGDGTYRNEIYRIFCT